MRLRALAVGLGCVALIGCVNKTDSQRISDAAKAEIAQRGKPTHISCDKPPARTRDQAPNFWACFATLRHSRTRYAACGFFDDPKGPVGECRFSRRPPPKHPEVLVIK
jgi:hypothetical protein